MSSRVDFTSRAFFRDPAAGVEKLRARCYLPCSGVPSAVMGGPGEESTCRVHEDLRVELPSKLDNIELQVSL